jgi:hypothetical protein
MRGLLDVRERVVRDVRFHRLEKLIEELETIRDDLIDLKHPVSVKHINRAIDRLKCALDTAYIRPATPDK